MAETLALDLGAPIVAGVGAAGLTIGTQVSALPSALLAQFRAERIINTCIQAPTGVVRYRSEAVDFWATDGVVDQVMLRAGYLGTLRGTARPGMTVATVEAALGPVIEDEEDNLILADVPGIILGVTLPPGVVVFDDEEDTDKAVPGSAVVSAMYVYQP